MGIPKLDALILEQSYRKQEMQHDSKEAQNHS